MKQSYSFLSCLFLLWLVGITNSYGQCSGQFRLVYPSGTGTTFVDVNNGTGAFTSAYCPTSATGNTQITVTPESPGTVSVTRSGESTPFASRTFTDRQVRDGVSHTFTLPPSSTTTTYTLTSIIDCPNPKNSVITLELAPTLSLTSSAGSNGTAICPGTGVTLTASGATADATYSLITNGQTIQQNTTGVFNVVPQASTTYTVTTTTPACGNGLVSQQIQVATNNITLNSNPVNTNITSGTSVTLTAAGGTAGQYTWTQRDPALTTITATGSQITVAPTKTTVYTVRGNTAVGNCPSSFSVTVTVNNQPLPVELVKFDAIWSNNTPKLSWATASEKNSAYFNIERSMDGVNFQVVGNQPGAGTKFSRTEYHFTDASFAETAVNTLYYRLHQVDITGESSYSPVRTVQVKGKKGAFSAEAFPNPYDEKLEVQFDAPSAGNATLTIHGFLGKTLLTKNVVTTAGTQLIKVHEATTLPAGMYYLTIRQGGQQQIVKLRRR